MLANDINEFGGSVGVTNPSGITSGPDLNLWFTESNATSPAIGRITPSGAIQTYTFGLSTNSTPTGITLGSDGALWFTDPGANSIGRIDTSGNITEYTLPTAGSNPDQIIGGPDNNLWFTEPGINDIGQITPAGVITQFAIPTANSDPTGITAGDGNVWFTESLASQIGMITPNGAITEFSQGITPGSDPVGITIGNDQNFWFTENTGNKIGRITPFGTVTEFSTGITAGSGPLSIAEGSDGALWFTEQNSGKIGTITQQGAVTEYAGPGGSEAGLDGIGSGPDQNLWFTESVGNHVDRISVYGTTTQFPSPTNALTVESDPNSITTGPDSALWFTESSAGQIGRMDTSANLSEYAVGGSPNEITLGPVPQGGGEANLWYTDDGGSNQGAIGEINAQGTVVGEFTTPTANSNPQGITLGPDGNLWFTERGDGDADGTAGIGRITPTGVITEFRTGLSIYDTPYDIATGPDGALWFTASTSTGGEIGRITTAGVITTFPITNNTSSGYTSSPTGITKGFGNDLWFTDPGNHAIGEITTAGVVTEFTQGLSGSDVPEQITQAFDGNYWFTDPSDTADPVGRITPQGTITLFQTPTNFATAQGITEGPDQNLWFTEPGANQIGQVVLTTSISQSAIPATVYATIPSGFALDRFSNLSPSTNSTNYQGTVDFGNGASSTLTIFPTSSPILFEADASYTFNKVGTYQATVTLSNDTGVLSPFSTPIIVISPITLEGSAIDGNAGTRANTLVGDFSDVDTTAAPADFTATIDWGDGSATSSGNILVNQANGNLFDIFGGHTYATSGTFHGTITLVDTRNNLTSTANFTSTITAAATQTAFNEIGPTSLTPGSLPHQIALGSDGALWFTEPNTGEIGRVNTSGIVTEYQPIMSFGTTGNSTPTGPDDITSGPDGNLWFTVPGDDQIGQLTTQGVFTFFASGISGGSQPTGITSGPDGNLWFTEQTGNAIGRITTAGVVTEFSMGLPSGFDPDAITKGPDGNLWFVGVGSNQIGRITPQGVITLYSGATGNDLTSITSGSDGDLWFTELDTSQIGKINPSTFQVTEYVGSGIAFPNTIVNGPDGNLYFTAEMNGTTPEVVQITTNGTTLQLTNGLTAGSNLQGIAVGPDGNMYFTESNGDRIGQLVLPQTSVMNPFVNAGPLYVSQSIQGTFATFQESTSIPTTANFQTIVNWGDGTPSQFVTTTGGQGNFTTTANHTYANIGIYHGTYQIFNASGTRTVNFTVNLMPAIIVNGLNFSQEAGRSANSTTARFTAPIDPNAQDTYDYTIQWGDGTTSTGVFTPLFTASGDITSTHTYASVGTYHVKTTVEVAGVPATAASGTSTATVTPFVSTLSATGKNLYQTIGNGFIGVVATFVDSSLMGSTPDSSLYNATINWGDGTPVVNGNVVPTDSKQGYQVQSEHNFTRPGKYNVTVVIKKTNGLDSATVVDSTLVEVAGPIDEVNAGLNSTPSNITQGPDGNLWFTEPDLNVIGRISTGGAVIQFDGGMTPNSLPTGIVTGPDGNLWFTQPGTNEIGRITTSGLVTEFPLNSYFNGSPLGIVLGPDSNLWFTESTGPNNTGAIGRITTSGVVTIFQKGITVGSNPTAITLGPDGNLWFTDQNDFSPTANAIGRITPQGVLTLYPVSTSSTSFSSITTGPDGALWFTEDNPGAIGRITTQGVVTQSANGLFSDSQPDGIAPAPDGNLWFVDTATNHVDRLTTGDVVTTFAIPTTNSQPLKLVAGPDHNLWFTETGAFQIGQVVLPESVGAFSDTQNAIAGQSSTVPQTLYYDESSLVDLTKFFTSMISFGDGTQGTGTLSFSGLKLTEPQFLLTSTHTYDAPGVYTGETTLTNAIGTTAPVAFTVNVSAASQLTFVVTNTNDSGPGSLRQVILNANQVGGHSITFAIPDPSGAVESIVVLSPLPTIMDGDDIDGTTEATYIGSTVTTPLVQVDGRNAGNGTAGLDFGPNSSYGSLLDLSIFGFSGAQVILESSSQSIYGNYLGLSADGSELTLAASSLPTAYGADGLLVEAPNQKIGGFATGQRNVISGNLGQGIEFSGALAILSTVENNFIGTDPSGTKALPNRINGISIDNEAGQEIIGPGNVISGNGNIGVAILGSISNFVSGNLIGVDASGEKALGNSNTGVLVDYGSSNNTIGGASAGQGNVISGNDSTGITIQGGSAHNLVLSNKIGIDLNGESAIGNGIAGILISDAPDNFVAFNVISGNGTVSQGAGVWIEGVASSGNQIQGNRIGTDATGEVAIGNSIIGVLINDAPFNLVGGNLAVESNEISGNTVIGVMISGEGAVGNLVAGNLIGTDFLGENPRPNGTGVYINNAPGNYIGGSLVGYGNLISGNSADGIQIFGPDSVGTLVEGNKIGTDYRGILGLGNGGNGLLVNGSPGTRIVGNLIDSNLENGVFISGAASTSTMLVSNTIGRGLGGEVLGNLSFGLLISNGAPEPLQVGNVNVNNTLGPIRDTSLAPATTTTTTKKTKASPKKTATKVQVKAASFNARSLTTLQTRGQLKSKAKKASS